jgi:hypothetical protein
MSAAAMRFVGAGDWAGRFSVGGVLVGFAIATVLRVFGYARVGVRRDRNGRVSVRIRRPDPFVWSGGWGVGGAILGVIYGFSRTVEEVLAEGAPTTTKRGRRAPSARAVILFAAVAIGVFSGLIERATTEWTGFGVGMGLFALLIIVGTPYLYGPLMSPSEIRRLEEELGEQARHEADTW